MKPVIKIFIISAVLFSNGLAAQQKQTAKAPAKSNDLKLAPIKLKARADSMQYALGVYMGKLLLQGGFTNIDANLFLSGIDDIFRNNPRLIKDEVVFPMIDQYQAAVQKERGKALEQELFAALKDKPNVNKLASGVQYIVIKPAQGIKPSATDSITMHFKGTLPNGAVFDNTFLQNAPATTTPASLVPGMNEVLQLMSPGATWQVFIPAALAYGEKGNGNVVPANSALLVTVELLDVKKK